MWKGIFIIIRTFIIESGQKLTEEQLKEIEETQKSPIVFDDDCEELAPAMIKHLRVRWCNETARKRLDLQLI